MPGRLDELRVVDAVLTGIAQGYGFPNMVGTEILPVKFASKSEVRIPQFGKEAFKLYNSLKAPQAKVNRVRWDVTYLTTVLERHALEAAIDKDEYSEAPDPELLRISRTKMLQNAINLRVEYNIASKLTNTNNYPTGHTITLSGTSQWNDYGNSDPIDDIETGKEQVRSAVGIRPNVLLLSAQAYKYLKNHPKLLDRVKYSAKGIVTADLIAEIFDLKKVLIGEAVYVDASGNFNDVWGKDAILAFVPDEVVNAETYDMPAFGYTIRKEGYPLVSTYAEPETTSEVIQNEDYISAWMTSGYAGYLIKNAVA